jgi:hypothetical protein
LDSAKQNSLGTLVVTARDRSRTIARPARKRRTIWHNETNAGQAEEAQESTLARLQATVLVCVLAALAPQLSEAADIGMILRVYRFAPAEESLPDSAKRLR